MAPITPGTVCLTCNTQHAAINDGVLVVVLMVDPARPSGDIYRIERIDGMPFGSTTGPGGAVRFFHQTRAWGLRSKLKPIDEQDPTVADMREIEVQRRASPSGEACFVAARQLQHLPAESPAVSSLPQPAVVATLASRVQSRKKK